MNRQEEPHSPPPPHRQPPPGSSLVSTQSNNAGGLIAGTGRDFFSSFSSEITNITSSTSTMFSGLFGKGGGQAPRGGSQPQLYQHQQPQHQQKPKEKSAMSAFDSFPGRKALVERTPLIKHTGPKQTQEELQRIQNAERSSSNSENQQFLKDVVNQVLLGEGVGWLKLNRMKKLMEDESYRMLVLGKMNRTLDKRIAPDDHIDDVVS